MPWVAIEPKYKRGDIDHAGRVLAQDQKPDLFEYQKALEIAGNWRSSHNWPLNIFQASLRARARKVSSKALIAQRLKRLTSIEVKLRRFPTMNLSQMQDLGGCRAVMNNAGQAYTLAAAYEHNDAKNRRRHEFVNKKDYIAEPKSMAIEGFTSSTDTAPSIRGIRSLTAIESRFRFVRNYSMRGQPLLKRSIRSLVKH